MYKHLYFTQHTTVIFFTQLQANCFDTSPMQPLCNYLIGHTHLSCNYFIGHSHIDPPTYLPYMECVMVAGMDSLFKGIHHSNQSVWYTLHSFLL